MLTCVDFFKNHYSHVLELLIDTEYKINILEARRNSQLALLKSKQFQKRSIKLPKRLETWRVTSIHSGENRWTAWDWWWGWRWWCLSFWFTSLLIDFAASLTPSESFYPHTYQFIDPSSLDFAGWYRVCPIIYSFEFISCHINRQ